MRPFTSIFSGNIGGYIRKEYFKRFLKQYCRSGEFKTMLDAGCGAGDYTFMVAGTFPDAIVYGFDLSGSENYRNNIYECLRRKAETGIKNIIFQQKDLLNLNEKEKYDIVYSIDVLEHIPGNKHVIKNIFMTLKKGGIFYLAMPWDKANKRLFPDFFFKDFDVWVDKEHIGEQYNLEELVTLMREMGFSILNAEYTFGFWGKIAWEFDKAFEILGPIRIVFKPFLKMIGRLDIYCKNKRGDLLVIAKRL